jgi:hypothetical protein
MLKGFLIAAALGSGIVGLISPAFSQNTGVSTVVTTDKVVVSRTVTVADRVVVTAPTSVTKYYAPIPGGGFGGSVGGYYINGTTRADNRPLPGGVWPYR